MVEGRNSLVWLDNPVFEKLQRGYLWMVAAVVHCGHRLQPMKSQGGYLLLDANIVHCGHITKLLTSHRETVYD